MTRTVKSLIKNKVKPNKKIADKHILIDKQYKNLLLEEEVWIALYLIGTREEIDVDVLIAHINSIKRSETTLESACRVFVVNYYLHSDISAEEKQNLATRYKTYISKNYSECRK